MPSVIQAVKLLVQRPRIVPGTVTANWNSGVATSGLTGADLVTIGAAGRWYRLTEAWLVLTGFNIAATITVRYYMTVAGAERVGTDTWIVTLDGPLAYLLYIWEIQLYGPIRIEVASDQAADDGFTATYEYRIKDW